MSPTPESTRIGGMAPAGWVYRRAAVAASLATVMIAPAAHSTQAGCDSTRPRVTHGPNTLSHPANVVPCLIRDAFWTHLPGEVATMANTSR